MMDGMDGVVFKITPGGESGLWTGGFSREASPWKDIKGNSWEVKKWGGETKRTVRR